MSNSKRSLSIRVLGLTTIFVIAATFFSPLSANAQRGVGLQDAGGSHGGGTDVINTGPKTGVIVDFETSHNEIQIDPTKFEGILDRLKPKLERLDYNIPGLRSVLEEGFQKHWKMTSEVFKPNHPGEIKPIKQTEDFVKITYSWFQQQSDEQKEKAWLHEMVRAYVIKRTAGAYIMWLGEDLYSRPDYLRAQDVIVQTLTPMLYNEEATERIRLVWEGVLTQQYIVPFLRNLGGERFFIPTRNALFLNIKNASLAYRFKELCSSALLNDKAKLSALIASPDREAFYGRQFFLTFGRRQAPRYMGEVILQATLAIDRNSAIQSRVAEAVARFTQGTESFLQGVSSGESYEFLTPAETNHQKMVQLSNAQRISTLKKVCQDEEIQVILAEILSQYERENGIVQYKTAPTLTTSPNQVDDFFRQRH